MIFLHESFNEKVYVRDIKNRNKMKCALCQEGDTAEDGHIIPNFVYRHVIKTSPTRFMRGHHNPNVRVQDGKTRRLLCPNCEDRFSRWERTFSRTVFHPLHIHQIRRDGHYPTMNTFSYGDWFLKFCVSVSWRSLYDLMLEQPNTALPHGDDELAHKTLEVWQKFLLDELDSVEGFRQHLIIVGAPTETQGIDNSLDLKLFFERGITNSTWHSPTESYVFTKMCRVIVVGTIKDMDNPWKGTLVEGETGEFSSKEQVISGVVNSWLRQDLADIPEARSRVSANQVKVIDSAVNRFLSKQ